MIERDVREVFQSVIKGENIILGHGVMVTIDKFCDLFDGVAIKYQALMEADQGKMGYAPFFQQCKEQGILPE